MFEDQTYEVILQRMLDRIPDDIDKREGSIIFDALAPAAMEIAQVYYLMGVMYQLIFGETTDGDMLTLRAADFGVSRKPATPSMRRGVFMDSNGQPMEIVIGSRFMIEDLIFAAVEKISPGDYILESEITGEVGNKPFGTLIPVENIDGLGSAELTEIIVYGIEEQDDDSLFTVFRNRIANPPLSGNEKDYERWAKEVTGIQDVRVYDQWAGPNTVKVVVTDTEKRSPSPQLIEAVWNHIESVRPVGAILTVTGVEEENIGLSMNLTTQLSANIEEVKASISENISAYFKSIAGVQNVIRYTSIGNAILDSYGVIDYSNLKVNGATSNIILGIDEVPVLGTLDVQYNNILGVK